MAEQEREAARQRLSELVAEERAKNPALEQNAVVALALERLKQGDTAAAGARTSSLAGLSVETMTTGASATSTFQPEARTSPASNAGVGTAEEMRKKRLEALEAKQRERNQELAATKVAPGNFKKRDWEKGTGTAAAAASGSPTASRVASNQPPSLHIEADEEMPDADVATKMVMKDGVLVRERVRSPSRNSREAVGDGEVEGRKGGAVSGSGEGSPMQVDSVGTGALANGETAAGGVPSVPASVQERTLSSTSSTGNRRVSAKKITVDFLEDACSRVEDFDKDYISDILLSAAEKLKEVEAEKKELERAALAYAMRSEHNLQVLAAIDYMLTRAEGLDAREPRGSEARLASALGTAQRDREEEQPKSYLVKRGDATHPVNNANGLNNSSGDGGAVGRATSGASPVNNSAGPGVGGAAASGATPTAGNAPAVRITWQATNPGGQALSSTGTAASAEDMARQKNARLEALEKRQAEAKKEREEAEKKAKARDALLGGVGQHR